MNWSSLEWEKPVLECTVHNREAKETISSFEQQIAKLNAGIRVYPVEPSRRLFDRSLLVLEGVNGDYFLHHLLGTLEVPSLRPPGFEIRCETTNLNRWSGPFAWQWWGESPLTESEQRSLVIFSAAFIKQQLSPEKVNKVYLDCLSKIKKQWEPFA
jgi:hypothetical protein